MKYYSIKEIIKFGIKRPIKFKIAKYRISILAENIHNGSLFSANDVVFRISQKIVNKMIKTFFDNNYKIKDISFYPIERKKF